MSRKQHKKTPHLSAERKIVQIGQTEPKGLPYLPHQVSLAIFLFYRNSWLVPLLRLSQKMVIYHFLKKEKLRSVKDSRINANLFSEVWFSAVRREVKFVQNTRQ